MGRESNTLYGGVDYPPLKANAQLVREAESLTAAPNFQSIKMCLKWYEYWCAFGNKAGAEASAGTLRAEIAKAKKTRREESGDSKK